VYTPVRFVTPTLTAALTVVSEALAAVIVYAPGVAGGV
jgi:hypothetical protein